jgi:hypothetical protein
VTRLETNEAGEPIPRIIVSLAASAPVSRDRLVEILRNGDPGIEVVLHDQESVAFSPHLLKQGEADQVTTRVSKVLYSLATGTTSA